MRKSGNFSKISVFDDFGDKFDSDFEKKAFVFNISDHSDFSCRGLVLDNRDHAVNLSKITEKLFDFVIKTLFSEEKTIFPEISSMKFDEKNRFSAKISFLNNKKIDGFSIEIQRKSLFWPNSLMISSIKSLYLSKNNQNTLKILRFLDKDESDVTIYRLNSQKHSLFSKSEKNVKFLNYSSFFTKSVSGSGLHQQVSLAFSLEGARSQFSKEIYKGRCWVLIVDFLDDTAYLDIEELIEDPSYVIYRKNRDFFNFFFSIETDHFWGH